jgi:hypothetical protein
MSKKNIATFTGPQKGLSRVGDKVYAYSGLIPATNGTISTAPTMLEFVTGRQPILVELSYNDTEVANYARYIRFLLNNVTVMDYVTDGSPHYFIQSVWKLIVPPLTELKVLANINGVTDNMSILLTGESIG